MTYPDKQIELFNKTEGWFIEEGLYWKTNGVVANHYTKIEYKDAQIKWLLSKMETMEGVMKEAILANESGLIKASRIMLQKAITNKDGE